MNFLGWGRGVFVFGEGFPGWFFAGYCCLLVTDGFSLRGSWPGVKAWMAMRERGIVSRRGRGGWREQRGQGVGKNSRDGKHTDIPLLILHRLFPHHLPPSPSASTTDHRRGFRGRVSDWRRCRFWCLVL